MERNLLPVGFILLMITVSSASLCEFGPMHQPLEHCRTSAPVRNHPVPSNSKLNSNPGSSVLNQAHDVAFFTDLTAGIISLYGRTLRPAMSRGCPSSPSCSEYMLISVRRFGFPAGYILGLERLLHESGELFHGCFVITPSGYRVDDPVENNIFWWKMQSENKLD